MSTLRLVTYKSAGELLAIAEPSLYYEEAKHSLLIGIASRLRDDPKAWSDSATLVNLFDEQGLVFSGVRTPPWELVASAYREFDPDEAARLLIQVDPTIPGVTAERSLADSLAAAFTRLKGCRHDVKFEQRVFQLREFAAPEYRSGRIRLPSPDEFPLMLEWGSRFADEAMGGDGSHQRQAMEKKLAMNEIFVWDDGGLKSMAGKGRPTKNSISIGYVYTPAEFRGQGYATSLVGALSQELIREYSFVTLFTDLANPTSNGIYQRLGYRPVCDFRQIGFLPGD